MKRSGFTMIELIFVIVIIGILSAVALPKFLGVATQAKVAKVKSFVGTLNMTVGPTLWSKSLSDGNNGKINTASYTTDLTNTITPPTNPATNKPMTIALAKCGTSDVNSTATTAITTQSIGSITFGNDTYAIGCFEGNATTAPHFWLYNTTSSNKIIVQ